MINIFVLKLEEFKSGSITLMKFILWLCVQHIMFSRLLKCINVAIHDRIIYASRAPTLFGRDCAYHIENQRRWAWTESTWQAATRYSAHFVSEKYISTNLVQTILRLMDSLQHIQGSSETDKATFASVILGGTVYIGVSDWWLWSSSLIWCRAMYCATTSMEQSLEKKSGAQDTYSDQTTGKVLYPA